MNIKQKRKMYSIIFGILTVIILLLSLGPLLWFAQISFKPQVLAWEMPPKFIFVPTFEHYKKVLTQNPAFWSAFRSSSIVSVATTAISLFLGLTSGYALARSRSRLTRYMGVWIILTRMAPPMIFLLPFYRALMLTKLSGTYTGIIIIYLVITMPFITWMMSSYFKTIPVEVEESAMLDGCGRIGTMFRIAVPMSLPGIVTCIIFSFIYSWNEFLFAMIVTGRKTKTMPILIQGLSMASDGIEWGSMAAVALLIVLPVLLVTMINQKGFVRGLTGGAIK